MASGVVTIEVTAVSEHSDTPDGPWEPIPADDAALKRFVRVVVMYGEEPLGILSADREGEFDHNRFSLSEGAVEPDPEPIIVEA